MGTDRAAPIIVDALSRMEYRGYDSAGIATYHDNRVVVRKGVGRVREVNEAIGLDRLPGETGIGHTRWATHGEVCTANAHPHASWSGGIAIVHNGIIENYLELRTEISEHGYLFSSTTDSEVIANLLQWNRDRGLGIEDAVKETVAALRGKYAFVAMFEDGTLAAARNHAPLIIGISTDGYFVSSDILGFINHTDQVIYLDNMEFALIRRSGLRILDFAGKPVSLRLTKVSNELADSDKGEYLHYTLKEIHDQPRTIVRAGEGSKEELEYVGRLLKQTKNVYITGSGTSYNAALIGKHLLSKYSNLRVEPIISSEAQFVPVSFDNDSVLIALSQSGESADVLEAVNIARENHTKVVSIVNVTTSALTRLSSISIGLNCGPEIGVAATKSFTSQMAVLYQITDILCGGTLRLDFAEIARHMSTVLLDQNVIQGLAKKMKGVTDIYVLGKGINYYIAAEASLKLKELSYIHAEALPSGELKHGPLALLDSGSYVLAMNPRDSTYTNTLAAAHEVKSRGATIIGVSDAPNEIYDHWIKIPAVSETMFPFIEIIPIQLLAYYAALERNANPDYPRNLAKSVTVK